MFFVILLTILLVGTTVPTGVACGNKTQTELQADAEAIWCEEHASLQRDFMRIIDRKKAEIERSQRRIARNRPDQIHELAVSMVREINPDIDETDEEFVVAVKETEDDIVKKLPDFFLLEMAKKKAAAERSGDDLRALGAESVGNIGSIVHSIALRVCGAVEPLAWHTLETLKRYLIYCWNFL